MLPPLIETLRVGPFDVQAYLVACPQTLEAVVIDPGGEEDKLALLCRQKGWRVRYILNTHGHADHTLGNSELKRLLGAPVAMHQADAQFMASELGREMSLKDLGLPAPQPPDLVLVHGQRLPLGRLSIAVIHTPGHSPGSACFLIGGNLFSGDTLFVGAVGRTDLPGSSLDTLLQSIEQQLLPLPDDTVVWPGHDYGETPTSTLGREKAENPFITDFILG